MLIANSLYGQTLSYEQTQDITVTSNYSNGDTLSSYIMKDGSEIKVGTKLKFGSPLNANRKFTRLYFGEYSLGKAF